MSERHPNKIKALLFDKDGTLFDFEASWGAWASGLLARLADGDHERAAHIGMLIGFHYETAQFSPNSLAIAGTPAELANALSPEFPDKSAFDLLTVINDEAATAPVSEAVPLTPLLQRFAENGLRLGVATNDAETPALAHLDAVNVRGHFDFIAGSDSGFGSKPQPGQLLAFCDRVGVSPADTAMVGDSTHDLQAGRAAGMWTVGVLTGPAELHDLSDHADVVFPDIGHLPGWLGLS